MEFLFLFEVPIGWVGNECRNSLLHVSVGFLFHLGYCSEGSIEVELCLYCESVYDVQLPR